MMVKGCKQLVSSIIKEHRHRFESKRNCFISAYHVYGTSVKAAIPGMEKEHQRYFHLYYSSGKAAGEREKLENLLEKMKQEIRTYLEEKGYEVINFGTDTHESCNYPEYGEAVGRAVAEGKADCGVLICGTGVGISLAANKVPGVLAAVCSEPTTARLAKEHNNANIIAFGARIVGMEAAKSIVDAYLGAEFLGGRHQKRVDMIYAIEKK